MARRSSRGRIPVALWLGACTLNIALGRCESGSLRLSTDDRVTRPLPAPPDSAETFRFEHRWSEARGGESPRLRNRRVDAAVAYENLRETVRTYGVPEEWTTAAALDWAARKGVSEEGRRRRELSRRAAGRGVAIAFEGNRISSGPDYDWIVRQSEDDVGDVARSLSEVFRTSGLETERGLHRVVTSFVQSIEYGIPDPSRLDADGRAIWNFGIATPIEVLHNKWGDCDSKCLLFASILRHFPDQNVVFLVGNDHMFAGVRDVPRRGDRYVKLRGVPYVLIELTGMWPFGRLPTDMWAGIGRNEYHIIRIGASTDGS